jgi:hypothetical protein
MMETSWEIMITLWEHMKSKKNQHPTLPEKQTYLDPMGACYLTSLGARFF